MRVWIAGLLVALAAATAHAATDPLAEARRFYNLGQRIGGRVRRGGRKGHEQSRNPDSHEPRS